jgi:hypothetical protein
MLFRERTAEGLVPPVAGRKTEGFEKTARASFSGFSNPTVMTRKGSASERQMGSRGMPRRSAVGTQRMNEMVEDMRMVDAISASGIVIAWGRVREIGIRVQRY